jgi:hypothetical protein
MEQKPGLGLTAHCAGAPQRYGYALSTRGSQRASHRHERWLSGRLCFPACFQKLGENTREEDGSLQPLLLWHFQKPGRKGYAYRSGAPLLCSRGETLCISIFAKEILQEAENKTRSELVFTESNFKGAPGRRSYPISEAVDTGEHHVMATGPAKGPAKFSRCKRAGLLASSKSRPSLAQPDSWSARQSRWSST